MMGRLCEVALASILILFLLNTESTWAKKGGGFSSGKKSSSSSSSSSNNRGGTQSKPKNPNPYPSGGSYPHPGGGNTNPGGYPRQNPASYPGAGSNPNQYPGRANPGGYPNQNPAGGYPAGGGYPNQNPAGGYPAGGGYPNQRPGAGGYPAGGGYPNQYPAAGGYPAGGGYPNQRPGAGGYPAGGGYPNQRPGAGGYPAGGGYPNQYPAAGGYPAGGGYPNQRPGAGGYPAAGGYPVRGGNTGQGFGMQPGMNPGGYPGGGYGGYGGGGYGGYGGGGYGGYGGGGYGGYPNWNPNNKILSPGYGMGGYGGHGMGGSPFSRSVQSMGYQPKSSGFAKKAMVAAGVGAMAGMAVGYGLGRFPRPHFNFRSHEEEQNYNNYMYRRYGTQSTDEKDYGRDYVYRPPPRAESYETFMGKCMNRTDLLKKDASSSTTPKGQGGSDEADDTVSIEEIGYPALIEQMKSQRCMEHFMVYSERFLEKQKAEQQTQPSRSSPLSYGVIQLFTSVFILLSSMLLLQ